MSYKATPIMLNECQNLLRLFPKIKSQRKEGFQKIFKDKEAMEAIQLLIEKDYRLPSIKQAYFFIKGTEK